MHGLPSDPRRRLRAGRPAEGDPFAQPASAAARRGGGTWLEGPTGVYARAVNIAEFFALHGDHPEATLVAGSTDWGVEVNIRGVRSPFVIGIDRVPELRTFDVTDDVTELGAALTLSEVEARLDGRIPLLAQLFPQFASRLIRNGATIGGNLGTASPSATGPRAPRPRGRPSYWRLAGESGRCRSPTTSPATARRSGRPTR